MNEQDKQEPVAWRWHIKKGIYCYSEKHNDGDGGQPLYAQPVQPDDLRQAALIDLAYINGAKAGWNMCVADDESQFQKLTNGVAECVNVLKNTRSQATTHPVQPAGAINEQLFKCLEELADVHDEPCRLDHHGYCQAHYLDDVNNGGCRVANAKAAIEAEKARGSIKTLGGIEKANEQAEHFEREWYLRGDEIEALKAQPVQPAVNEQLLEALITIVDAKESWIDAKIQAEKAIRAAEAAKGGV